ncbi:acetate/propionate family kinase [Siccirubricoccus sp. G192]|uniref:acetate/propionate family kinase n=1 Tax=Siccirubricoccus sp. G192 TaxID=2849651 RepID=UPI001C2BF539|nr:acetate/propionate family kinase [Siccirubricoccus sp. G192]MBV1799308.1 acetate/propionate family kinase [Siccirubricoccus sp. G192]
MIRTGDAILVLNAGSSSIKFGLFEATAAGPETRLDGQMEGIGATPHLIAHDAARRVLADRRWSGPDVADHAAALAAILEGTGQALAGRRIAAIGHRVVHGGPDLAAPVLVDAAVLARLRALVPLAPLHQPHNLAGIEAMAARFPGVPQLACFDTAFHRSHPWEADTYALPPEFHARGIRRYGFHGLSYEYISRRIAAEDAALGAGRLVVAHLGNGSSLCAVRGGRSLDSSMGFTALDGVPMGTRCGQIDPGVLLHLLEAEGMGTAALTRLLYNDAGLKGMSGLSQDVRELEASARPEAARALSHFAWRVRREIGALAATLGGIDALVFTAGIGENAAALRGRICEGLDFLGIRLDPGRNAADAAEISVAGAPVRVLVRRTDEERMIAEHILATLARA